MVSIYPNKSVNTNLDVMYRPLQDDSFDVTGLSGRLWQRSTILLALMHFMVKYPTAYIAQSPGFGKASAKAKPATVLRIDRDRKQEPEVLGGLMNEVLGKSNPYGQWMGSDIAN